MPDPLHSRWQTVDDLFNEAVRRTGTARGAFLDRACDGQPALRAAVERMLWADEAAGTFLERPLVSPDRSPLEALEEADDTGLCLGPYRLVERIAEGGMGAVYRAERTDGAFERAVAVKMVRRRIVRAEGLQRFRTEREVLSRLDHPNIARLLDGGTTADGRPFLVMELVDGWPIDRYCAEKGLGLEARVRLFQQLCAAIEYAHQNLLVHRDIKPANVLVTKDAVVKVLDFGIAKLLVPESLPFVAPVTRTGLRPMTPGYASPEQIRGQPATTRSDVFVLGALLYELLTGRSPFLADGRLPHEVEAAICAADGLPAAPSRRARRAGSAFARALGGDLGTIVGKALRADPARRYGSVEQFSDDLTRWAEHRPVRARPDRLTYRLRTFARRHRAWVALSLTAFIGMAVLSLALALQSREAVRERDRTARALGFVIGIFEGAETGPGAEHQAVPRAILDRSAERIERELSEDPDMQAMLFDAIGRMYTSLGWYGQARRSLERSLALRPRGEDRATGLYHLARALDGLGRYEEAWARYDDSLQIRRRLFGPEHPAVAEALSARADVDLSLGRYARAEAGIREALRVRRARLGDDPLAVAESLSRLGDVLFRSQKDIQGVVRAYREALEIREAKLGGEHLLVADSLRDTAEGLFHAGRGQEALPVLQRAVAIQRSNLSEDHPELAAMLYAQGELARVVGSVSLAEASLREAIGIARARLGALHPETAHPRLSLGALLVQQERLGEAEEELRQVRLAYEASYPAGHPQLASLAFWSGDLLRRQGDYEGARGRLEESWSIVEHHIPAGTIVRATVKVGLGRLALDTGETEAALALFNDALVILERRMRPEWFLGEVETEVGWCQAVLGRAREGRTRLRRGLERLERERPADDPKIARARDFLREIERRLERGAGAEGTR